MSWESRFIAVGTCCSILACANGLGSRVIQAINRAGWTDAALGTFEISAIVFTVCAAGVWLILRDSTDKIRSADLVVAVALLLDLFMETLVVARTDPYAGYSPTALPSLTRTWPTTPRGLRLHIVLSRFQATATTPSSMSADHENAF